MPCHRLTHVRHAFALAALPRSSFPASEWLGLKSPPRRPRAPSPPQPPTAIKQILLLPTLSFVFSHPHTHIFISHAIARTPRLINIHSEQRLSHRQPPSPSRCVPPSSSAPSPPSSPSRPPTTIPVVSPSNWSGLNDGISMAMA